MKLETDRLTLIPAGAGKFDDIYKVFTNEFVRKFLCDDTILSKDQVQSFIYTSDKMFIENNYGLWLLYTKDTNAMIGLSGLWSFFEENQPQLLYALLPEYTKNGYAKEASLKIIEYSFNQLGFSYLDASCDAPNIESHKVALTLGMKKLKEEIIDNKPIIFYRIKKNEI
ncbi:MAG: GNAT family N-acetyltransferase [Flammeovirgaceae bacterium]